MCEFCGYHGPSTTDPYSYTTQYWTQTRFVGIRLFATYGVNENYIKKGSENDSDALSRREDLVDITEVSIIDTPVLKQEFEDYDDGFFEKELEDLRESLMEIYVYNVMIL